MINENKNNIGSINVKYDHKNKNKTVTMVIILETIKRNMILKLIKQWLNKFIFHNSNPEKKSVPTIHKVQYIGRIISANFNIIKMAKLRHFLPY